MTDLIDGKLDWGNISIAKYVAYVVIFVLLFLLHCRGKLVAEAKDDFTPKGSPSATLQKVRLFIYLFIIYIFIYFIRMIWYLFQKEKTIF
jgi:hypothetical protein